MALTLLRDAHLSVFLSHVKESAKPVEAHKDQTAWFAQAWRAAVDSSFPDKYV